MKHLIVIISLLFLIGCNKPPVPSSTPSSFTNGFLTLNEGLFQQNNSSLSFYDYKQQAFSHTVFNAINKRGLGDTANDMISFTYKGKLYYAIAVSVSSQLEIMDGLTLSSIAQIPLFFGSIARQPRSLQFNNDHLYSINFDGTVSVIDMETLSETQTISVGNNPESSLIFQDKLYVVNTGGLNYPNYDSTISVIDLENNTVESSFTVGINGSNLIVDKAQNGFMISRGNYDDIKPKLVQLDLINFSVIAEYDINIITMAYTNETLYYYDDLANGIYRFNTQTGIKENQVFIDCSDFKNVYNIIINEEEGLIYVVDANGYVNSSIIRIYNYSGEFQREVISGLNTNTIIFTP